VSAPRRILLACLFALAALFAAWFRDDRHFAAGLLVFVAPPLLLALALASGAKRAPFWAGVFALFWFCHGVMAAWTRPGEAAYAWAEIALSLAVVLASNWPALAAKSGKRP
jgi:uncharacterized membrane protein